ncbi:ABC transporter ATP-binding protein [Cupriavidus taiwanensis]|uniref:ABC transporter ATP-binding protein n=1 Tax=Cupriavidus taiwanensis TaxID=164546 RepID=UPI0020C62BFE|nr:ABC transporter ATP-binding protein [Cupriavidus taiwanensis]
MNTSYSMPVDLALDVDIAQFQPMALAGAFRCEPGELLALVGPSGAGKTSMLRVLAGLMRPERGRVTVGTEIWCDTARGISLPPQRRHVGLVFQHYALMPHLSALENVALSLLHLPRRERQVQARHWLAHMRLTPAQQSRLPAALSGGQQQRVAVARALAREPRLLLLDEPFSAVDQMSRQALYRLLADLRRELSIPIVLVTHDLNEARMLADRLVVMDAGHVLQQGTPDMIHSSPRNARVADLVGIHNHFRGQWMGPADQPGWAWLRWRHGTDQDIGPLLRVRDKGRLPTGQLVTWVIPGDGITVIGRQPEHEGEFRVQVAEVRHLGEITLATLTLSDVSGTPLRLTLSGPQRLRFTEGVQLCVHLNLDLVHVMPVRPR